MAADEIATAIGASLIEQLAKPVIGITSKNIQDIIVAVLPRDLVGSTKAKLAVAIGYIVMARPKPSSPWPSGT